MKAFSREDLAKNNGESGAPAFVAYRGVVYDVTTSPLWAGGGHQGLHGAGRDLADDLDSAAPHGTEVLERYPRIGTLNGS